MLKRKWEPCDCCPLPSVSPTQPPRPLFLLCLCFGSPPRTSSVFVSHCINSVMVMSGMCINSDLPYPCLPLSLLSLSHLPSAFPFIPARPCPAPYLSPPSTFNPRMAPITRTCWCVRLPWEWPPVSLLPWEASPALLTPTP